MSASHLPLRVVYFGTPDFAVPALEALCSHPTLCHVALCVTQPDKARGRGQEVSFSPVKSAATAKGVEVIQPLTLKDDAAFQALQACDADLFVVAAYGKILPQRVLDLPRLGCVNLHASLLPRWRGAAPIAYALKHGDTHSGICLMRMEAGLDTGPVYARSVTAIQAEDNAQTLTARLAEMGAALLIDSIPLLARGDLTMEAQPEEGVTYAHKITKQQGVIDFSLPAAAVLAHIRAFTPWPSAFTFCNGKRLQIISAHIAEEALGKATGHNGAITIAQQRMLIECGDLRMLEILTLKPEGKGAMSVAQYLNGKPLLKTGDVLQSAP